MKKVVSSLLMVCILLVLSLPTSHAFPTGRITCSSSPDGYGRCSLKNSNDIVTWTFDQIPLAEDLLMKRSGSLQARGENGESLTSAQVYLQFATLPTDLKPGLVFETREATLNATNTTYEFVSVLRDSVPAGIEGGFTLTMSLKNLQDESAPVFTNQVTDLSSWTWELDLGFQYRPGSTLPETNAGNPPLIYSYQGSTELFPNYGGTQIYKGDINLNDNEDWYAIEVGSKNLVTVQLRRGWSGTDGLTLEVFDENYQLIESFEEYSRPTVRAHNTNVLSETWRIKISHPNPNQEYIDYRLSIFSQSQDDAGLIGDAGDIQGLHSTLPSSGSYLGTLGWGDNSDWYAVVINNPSNLILHLEGINEANFYISQICSSDDCYHLPEQTLEVTTEVTSGIWYFQITTNDSHGLYWLDIQF